MDTVIEEKVMGMVNAAKEGVDASKQGDAPQAELSMDFRSIQAGTNGNLASLRLFGWLRKAGEERPSYFTTCLSFDIASGRLLGDGDLFAEGYQEKLKELCAGKLAETYPDQNFLLGDNALDGIAQRRCSPLPALSCTLPAAKSPRQTSGFYPSRCPMIAWAKC